jgi:hypothetical protein
MHKLSEIKLPTNQKFGLFFCVIFILFGLYYLSRTVFITGGIFLVLGVIFLITTIAKPDLLLPINKLWMRFGLLLGMFVGPIVLGIIFFGLLTPIAFVMRLFGRDELSLNINNCSSFWKPKETNQQSLHDFKNQF